MALDMDGGARKAKYVGMGEDPALRIFGYIVQAEDRDYIGILCVPAPVSGDRTGITVPHGSSITDNAGNHADLSWEDTSCQIGFYLNEVPVSSTTLVSISAGALHTCGVSETAPLYAGGRMRMSLEMCSTRPRHQTGSSRWSVPGCCTPAE